ncbi:MAG TPA: hypothetical protein PKA53_00730 [Sphingobacterium sp.]|nr:hypothetical protein [Sphingobacterium sp.]
MKFHIPFDEEIYRAQINLNFNLAWGKSMRTNKWIIFMMIPLLLFGLFTWARSENDLGLILACLSGCLSYLAISRYQQYVTKKKEYLRLVEAEIKEYKEINEPVLFEFQDEFFRYKNHKCDLKFNWATFTKMTFVDSTLILNIHAMNAFLLSEEEVGKDIFADIVAYCKANIANQTHSNIASFNF